MSAEMNWIVRAAEQTMHQELGELGESPEAWRGAIFVSQHVNALLQVTMEQVLKGHEHQPDDTEVTDISHEMFVAMSTLTGMMRAIARFAPNAVVPEMRHE